MGGTRGQLGPSQFLEHLSLARAWQQSHENSRKLKMKRRLRKDPFINNKSEIGSALHSILSQWLAIYLCNRIGSKREVRIPKANDTWPRNFLEVIFLPPPLIFTSALPANDVNARLVIPGSRALILLFSCITLGSEPGAWLTLKFLRGRKEVLSSLSKAPSRIWGTVWQFMGPSEEHGVDGPQVPFRVQGTRALGEALRQAGRQRRWGCTPTSPHFHPGSQKPESWLLCFPALWTWPPFTTCTWTSQGPMGLQLK